MANNEFAKMSDAAEQLCQSCNESFAGNPFASPEVIFSDAKNMQWFKKYLLELEQKEIFANIRFRLIGELMKDYLGDGPAALCHQIFAYLKQNLDDDVFKEVKTYCDGQDSKLFDLSSHLTSLFLEYRQLDKVPEDIFGHQNHAKWEKRIYEDVMLKNLSGDNGQEQTKYNSASTEFSQVNHAERFYFGPNRLTGLQRHVLDLAGCVKYLYTEADKREDIDHMPEISVCEAPSKLREVENLHSQVCILLQKGQSSRRYSSSLRASTTTARPSIRCLTFPRVIKQCTFPTPSWNLTAATPSPRTCCKSSLR